MQSVATGIFYENTYPGVTLGAVIMPRGTLMIDAPLRAEDARTWKSVLLTQSRGTHRLLVNLDGHTDRAIGTRHIDCTIVAQQNVLEVFEQRTAVFKGQPNDYGAEWENYPEVIGTRWNIPSLTFSEQLVLHWAGADIVIEHRPGPTPGSVWVVVPEEKVVFVGDTITYNQPPFFASGNLPSWIKIMSDLRSPRFRDYQVISGRGGPVDMAYVRAQHEQFKTLLKKLEALAEKDAAPDATEELIEPFLSSYDYPESDQAAYEQRLRFGFTQYFQRHYIPENSSGN